MRQHSREHAAISQFQASTASLRPVVEGEGSADYLAFFDEFTDAMASFIMCELKMRTAERARTLNVYPEYATYGEQVGTEFNERGLISLRSASEFLATFIETKPETREIKAPRRPDREFQNRLDQHARAVRSLLVDVEIKAADAAAIDRKLQENHAALAKGGGAELLALVRRNLDELQKVRSSRDRGTADNIPIWKLLAAAVLLAVGAWAVYACYYRPKKCSNQAKQIYNAILVVAVATYGACE